MRDEEELETVFRQALEEDGPWFIVAKIEEDPSEEGLPVAPISLDGDGSMLMNMGTIATIGREKPRNLIVIVWDNEQWAQTGNQSSHTAFGTDLEDVAKGCGRIGFPSSPISAQQPTSYGTRDTATVISTHMALWACVRP